MKFFLILLITTFSMSLQAADDRFASVQVKVIPVTDNIFMLVGAGGNIGVSYGTDGMLMIDDQFEPLAAKIKTALNEIGPEAPTFLLNTHYHGDHTGGNAVFGEDSIIMAHHNVRIRLVDGEEPQPASALPVITYSKQASVHFNGEEIILLHTPSGHTDGDTVVHFSGSNVVHMGDNFFKDRFPYVDINAGGSVDGLISALETVLAMVGDDTQIIPGHGSLANKSDLTRYYEMIKATSSAVKKMIEMGKTEQQILDAGLDPKWDSWGSGFINEERWIKTLTASYQ